MKSEQILAIPANTLWTILDYIDQGVIYNTDSDIISRILAHTIFKRRDILETDPSHKQIIPYAVICHEDDVYLFRRTSKQTEKRLHNMYSLGVGGHMNPYGESNDIDYLHHELERELREEVKVADTCSIESILPIGYINDDKNEVGKVHLGVLYEIRLSSKEIEVNEKDKMTGRWVSRQELKELYPQMESWSKIYIDLV